MAMSGPMGTCTPYILVRDRDRNLAAAVEFDEPVRENLKVTLVPGVVLAGKVTDIQGTAIPGIELSLTFWPGQMGYGMREETATPDPTAVTRSSPCRPVTISRSTQRPKATARNTSKPHCRSGEQSHGPGADGPQSGEPRHHRRRRGRGGQARRRRQRLLLRAGTTLPATGQGGRPGPVRVRGVLRRCRPIQANTTNQASRSFGWAETEGGATDVKIVVSPRGTAGRFVPAKPPSLVGKPLPSLADVGSNRLRTLPRIRRFCCASSI